MMHPNTELRYISKSIGYGVFATEFIPKGTITWVLDDLDQKFEKSYVDSLAPIFKDKLLKYSYRDCQNRYILCWDLARYVNHSFNPTCITTAYEFELAAVDIYPGDELTDDYGWLNLEEPFDCFPEEGCTRTKVMPDDILHFYQEWDRRADEAMKHFNQVEQPLKPFIYPQFIDKINAVAEGREEIDSILSYYFGDPIKMEAMS